MFSNSNVIDFIDHLAISYKWVFPEIKGLENFAADVYLYNGYVLCIDKTYLIVRIQKKKMEKIL